MPACMWSMARSRMNQQVVIKCMKIDLFVDKHEYVSQHGWTERRAVIGRGFLGRNDYMYVLRRQPQQIPASVPSSQEPEVHL